MNVYNANIEQERKEFFDIPQEDPWNIRWHAEEYTEHKKSADWYWWLGIITIVIVTFAVHLDNILFAFIVVIASFTLALYSVKKPEIIEYSVTERGIRIGKKLYLYQSFDAFCIHKTLEDDDDTDKKQDKTASQRRLFLKSHNILAPLIVIPLANDVSTESVRELLLEYIQEEKMEEPLSQKVINLLKI